VRFAISHSLQKSPFTQANPHSPADSSLSRPLQRQTCTPRPPCACLCSTAGELNRASYATRPRETCAGAALLPSFRGGFPGRAALQPSRRQTTWSPPSRPAAACSALTATRPLHLSGELCLRGTGSDSSDAPHRLPEQTGRRERDRSVTARAGWHSPLAGRAGSRPAVFSLQLESRGSEAEHPHAGPTRRALGSSYDPCVAARPPPRWDTARPERGGKRWPRRQTSTGQGLQHAGSPDQGQQQRARLLPWVGNTANVNLQSKS